MSGQLWFLDKDRFFKDVEDTVTGCISPGTVRMLLHRCWDAEQAKVLAEQAQTVTGTDEQPWRMKNI